ncbi:uncharacterized protein LOC127357645 [Dicentrarchus labrax]|uniref:uncharacterized protein LOC127357645 n=1 Tax=Dicentrarchus labrax TaxID=13489 RepID=UPI0021F584BC|nr:uncharacterized protein LOC127357645 [Dicentrarchus labrax]
MINMEGREETRALQQAIGVLRTILSSSETVTSLSSSLEQRRTSSSGPNVTHSTAENETRELFRPRNSQVASAAQAANVSATQGRPGGLSQSLQYETQLHFGNWGSRKRKRAKSHYHDTFNKDIILLPKSSSSAVIRHCTKQQLHEQGQSTVTEQIRDAFGEKHSDVSLEFLMACGNRLISPKLRAGQKLDANLTHKIYRSKALYIRPSKPILDDIAGCSSGENNCEEITGSARQLRSSSLTRDRPSYASSENFTSPMTVSPPNCFCNSTIYLITWGWRDIYTNFFFDLPKQYISQLQQHFSMNYSKYTFVASLLKQ